MQNLISLGGLLCMVAVAWALSAHRWKINWKLVAWGVGLQFTIAFLMLRVPFVRRGVEAVGGAITGMLGYVDVGSEFLFGPNFRDHFFAFRILPTIIFFSALMSLLYYLRVIPLLVRGFAWVMSKTMGASGAETLSASTNVFVGMTEAPLVVKPYLAGMTKSELMCVMVGGLATVAGGVMAIYISFGIDPAHLITASVISAPAALVVAKIMYPETEVPATAGTAQVEIPQTAENALDAVTSGVSDGLKLALNIGAMLIAFLALIALCNGILGWAGKEVGMMIGGEPYHWSLEAMLAPVFYPFAFVMGIPMEDCGEAGSILGLRMVTNELVAYQRLGGMEMAERSRMILTYALCGFASFSSIGVLIGGLSAMAEGRRKDLCTLGFRAMIGGTLACFMTACIAGVLL